MTDPRPIQRPFDARMLSVGDGHWLYVEQVGRAGGIPAVFLHGGPGSGSQHVHRELFDPERYHAILFDQRGAGRSHPYLSRQANTTAHQIADIEAIRAHLGIDRWIVVGGSWGSTLGLAYAQAHPERVAGMVLRAIFLGTASEVTWAFIDGPQRFRPELYTAFAGQLPDSERADPIAAYVARLTDPDPAIHQPAAHVWHAYERTLSELSAVTPDLGRAAASDDRLPPTPLIEAHYIAHHFFLAPDQLVANAWRLRGIPGVLIQGRYDLLCPPAAAAAVAQAWGTCRLQVLEQAGHAMTEPGVTAAMRAGIAEVSRTAFGH